MMFLLVCLLAIIVITLSTNLIYAEQGTYAKKIKFIQYLDENTALEEVKNGNLDFYYYRISSDRIENTKAREGINVYDSTGGSYSILVNPAESEKFNPFSIRDVRFALNYLIDRKLIVNELMGGFGTTMVSNYGPFDTDYLLILNQLEEFQFRYNPSLADKMISDALEKNGATKINGKWFYDDGPISITIFIRSDDPVRKSIGEILASNLENIGFTVTKDFGDLNKAFVIVYGSNPSDLKWNLYTEGWAGRSAFVKYDSLGLAQMYSPWFSNMPGFNDPSYWNYKNAYLDSITQRIYTGNFSSSDERTGLIQQATTEAINESVRIFLASKIDQYVVNDDVLGVVNDFGAGVPSRFTAINSRSPSDSLNIGVKQIYQGAWNPVMGLSDSYSTQIWYTIFDPALFKHPYTGETFPIRSNWDVETAGPDGKLNVPSNAILWNPNTKSWIAVSEGTKATSKVRFDLTLSNWHNGQAMDMNDILHSIYFTLEWGSQKQDDDKTFDTEFTPRAAQVVNTLVGIVPVDGDTIDVYVDYWHFDDAEIADWASMWSSMPWEIFAAMEQAVMDGKVSFSRSGAVSKNVNWLSLIIPKDSHIIREYLEQYRDSKFIPKSLESFENDDKYFESRYSSSIAWIAKYNHAVISNGPYYLDNYSPESRTITVNSFIDESYPYGVGYWNEFENVRFPKIVGVDVPDFILRGEKSVFSIQTDSASQIQFFISNPEGLVVSAGSLEIIGDSVNLELSPKDTSLLGVGANNIKLFVISDSVLRPDIFSTSFLAVDNPEQQIPETIVDMSTSELALDVSYLSIFLPILAVIIILVLLLFRKKFKNFRR